MLPSEYPEIQTYSNLKRLLQAQIDMQFADLRALLRLPLPNVGLEGGCNFAAAAVLFNIIAGSSVCFYSPSEAALAERQDRGKRFTELLEKYYPWRDEPIARDQCVKVLYESARNPLAHSLGLDIPPKGSTGNQIALAKDSLTNEQIRILEESSERPRWIPSTIVRLQTSSYGAVELAISIPSLYWGVHRMLRALFADPNHVIAADTLAGVFSPQWGKYVSDAGHFTE